MLTIFNVYNINAYAEELCDKFVAHEGGKQLTVVSDAATIEGTDFGNLAVQLSGQIHENVKEKSLVPWVLPNFSTTTANDTVICSVLVMSVLKSYFEYEMIELCGIPSITFEGTQADWQSILTRINKIPEFGEQPKQWAGMLRAILARFVCAFDAGGVREDKDF